ncbi:MAG: hypothetical protein V3W41_12345, partial [Planctomycetota bacterium]
NHPSDGPDVDLRLRLEADELVVTVIVNLAFCDEFLDLAREDEEFLAEEEKASLYEALGEIIAEKMRVATDGIAVDAVKREFEALPIELSVLSQFPKFGMRAITRVRARFVYSLKAAPRSVGLSWNLYPENLAIGERGVVPLLEIKSEWLMYGESVLVDFKPGEPEHTWHGEGKAMARRLAAVSDVLVPVELGNGGPSSPWILPLVIVGGLIVAGACLFAGMRRRSVVVAGVAVFVLAAGFWWQERGSGDSPFASEAPNGAKALAIFEPLHANIYRAFDFSREEEVYDALARSIAGEHLDEIYNQVYRGLVLQDQGGAVSRIQSVDMIELKDEAQSEAQAKGRIAFAVVAKWRVKGRVFHWGHTHWRTNEYQARYVVAQKGEAWKIIESKVLGQRRIALDGDDPVDD